ncbi:lipopolysaccharide biosynthesis protein [Nostoc sp.]|uniref:lipopolysaccharide biosynthesis protein n=1 Tax=Nostoc sp. TaxID=1180 RepID=UPI002FFAA57D
MLITKFKQQLSSRFIRNIGWLGLGELIPRIFRLGITVILAHFLSAYDYGLAAIVMTVGEFSRVFTELGIGAKIIQADKEELEELCNSAYWLTWIVLPAIFIIQCLAAFPISWFYGSNQIILPICVSGIPYLIWPISAIQGTLIERENRLKITAFHNTIYTSGSYILSAILAFCGMGMWSIVLPWVLIAPIGVYIYYVNHTWRPSSGMTTKHWKEIFNFGKNFLGIRLLGTLRNNLDYLIVGRFLGVEELGIYFFGFNAGLGISLSIIGAVTSAILPHLCEARADKLEFKKVYLHTLKTIGIIIIPWVILQSSLAPFYVPLVFGQKWVVAIPILILVCLSAIPRPFANAASQLLVAIGRPDLDFRWNILFTTLFSCALLIGVHWQAIGVATSVLLLHFLCLPLFTLWVIRYVFPNYKNLSIKG